MHLPEDCALCAEYGPAGHQHDLVLTIIQIDGSTTDYPVCWACLKQLASWEWELNNVCFLDYLV